jgi:hypothetical protein
LLFIFGNAVQDGDVVLLMDAYDVILSPSILNAAAVLAQSPVPLLFCAERGTYPEFTSELQSGNVAAAIFVALDTVREESTLLMIRELIVRFFLLFYVVLWHCSCLSVC